MAVEHVEFLVEEQSMELVLRELLPHLLGDLSYEIYRHRGKEDLLAKLSARLRGYAKWMTPEWRVVVVVDRDDDDCHELKEQLERAAAEAGLATRSASGGEFYTVVNRIVVEELEAWYFGDPEAIKRAYPRVPATLAKKARFRDPDAITGGTWEAFEQLLQRAGYFSGGLRKLEIARAISQHMVPKRNRSHSFQVFRTALEEMVAG